jgi:hypothetical protein
MRTLPTIKRTWPRVGAWVAAASLALLTLAWPSPASAACTGQSFPCDWQFKRKLTFNNATVAENLVDFPVLVVLNSSRIDYSQTQNAGQDLRFTDSDGATLLAHEIEQWDEAGTSYVWVKVPQIDASSTTDHIWMFYGNASAVDGQNPTGVWSNGFEAVYHLHNAFNDSTGLHASGTNSGSTSSTGRAANGRTFNGSSHFINTNWTSNYGASQNFTWEGWFKVGASGIGGSDDILGIEDRATGAPSGLPEIRLAVREIASGSPNPIDQYDTYIRPDSGTLYTGAPSISPTGGQWHHAVLLRNGSTGRLYLDGSEVHSGAVGTNALTFRTTLLIGAQWDTAVGGSAKRNYFQGDLDEVRTSTTARTAGWVKATYLTLTDAYITYGAQEAATCPPPAPFAPCSWQKRRKLTFNNSAQAENLVNFPVLVVLNSSRIDYGQTQNAGQDLRFTDSDGVTLLAHEIEKWDEAGTSIVWVKVPQIDASSTTDHIWMYYGNATVADGQDAGAVWSNGYAGVWHLNEASSATRQDSTCNNNDVADTTTVAGATGKIGGAADFDVLNSEYLTISDAAQTGLDLTTQFTLEAWAKTDSTSSTRVVLGKSGAAPQSAYNLRLGGDRFSIPISFDGTGFTSPTGDILNGVSGSVSIGTWYYSVATFDGSTLRLYRDGPQETSKATFGGTLHNSTTAFNIGARNNGTQPFDGTVDEARVSNVVRSAAWISAQHKSMTDVFITFGGAEVQGSSVSYYSPDAAAAGMHMPVTFVGSFCGASPTVTTSSTDIVVGPSILTDATGAVVASDGKVLSTMFFVKPDARPKTGITVTVDGTTLSQTFDLVIPAPDPNISSGTGTLSGRTDRGTTVLGGLTVGASGTLTISKTDSDGATAGNQGYLPPVILVKGDVNIAGTVDVKGQDGTSGGASCAGGTGGAGGPGGGGGGGGGVNDGTCSGGSGTINVRVSTGSDDAEEVLSSGLVNISDSDDLDMVDGQTPVRTIGIRFQNITIPQGATITNAYLEFTASEAKSGTTSLTFEGQASDNAPTFTTATNDITSRPKSSASVTWSSVPSWSINLAYQTPNLSAVIQEIVNRSGWASGNSLVIIVSGSGDRDAKTYENSSAQAALLHVDYGSSAGSTAASGGAGRSGGGGGASKGTGTGGAGGDGSGAVGNAASGTTGGDGGTALGGATGGGGASGTEDAGGGGTGNPFGTGGRGGVGDLAGGAAGEGGGGGGVGSSTAGGGGGGGFATAGVTPPDDDAGQGGLVNSNAQLVPLSGGSGGGGGGPDSQGPAGHRGGGGGGGGGAILLYATGTVNITGTLTAAGGNGGNGYTSGENSAGGGGGGGGAILLQSGSVTASGTLTTAAGTGGTSTGNAAGGAGGTGRIRIDGLAASATVPGTAGSKFIGPVIDKLVGTNVSGRADGGTTVTLYVYDQTGAQVSGSPYSTSASGSSGTVGTWTISSVTFPSGTGYLAVKQSSGSMAVLGPGRASKGIHLINWREVY